MPRRARSLRGRTCVAPWPAEDASAVRGREDGFIPDSLELIAGYKGRQLASGALQGRQLGRERLSEAMRVGGNQRPRWPTASRGRNDSARVRAGSTRGGIDD